MKYAGLLLSFSLFATELPVLDMRDYYNESRRVSFVDDLAKDLHDYGAVIITHVGISREVTGRAESAMRRFFALDASLKVRYNSTDMSYQRGYVPFKAEVAKGAPCPDIKELYHFGKSHNLYPKEVPMQDAIDSYYRELEHYMTVIQEAIARGLGMPKNFFVPMTSSGHSLLRFVHYPQNKGIWGYPHTDIGLFSLFHYASRDGLEVQKKSGEWIPVKVAPDGVVLVVGEFLENLTNGYYFAPYHRAFSPEGEGERYTSAFFVHPKGSDSLAPLPKMLEKTGGKVKYANVTAEELLMERLADLNFADYDMLKKLADSGAIPRLREVGRASDIAIKRLEEHGLL